MDQPPEIKSKKVKPPQLPHIRNTRLTKSLDARVEEYLRKNNLSYNMLVRMALEEFISVPHTWKLEPVERESVKATLYSIHDRPKSPKRQRKDELLDS